jgi:tetrapyrrole methylase family protein/MazG family protein/ATP diphosphatase
MAISPPSNRSHIDALLYIMRALRDPNHGCPWDIEQNFSSIAPYTLEEAYEVADAIARSDMAGLCEELGDLLLQVVYHARMAEEAQHFAFTDVVAAIVDKMLRRHPHVFGDEKVGSAQAQSARWEDFKKSERERREGTPNLTTGIPRTLPELVRAQKLQKRAAAIGFDWPSAAPVRLKIQEEFAELDAAECAGDQKAIEEEIGDILFACVNLSRHLGVDAEAALARSNRKFAQRFRFIEESLAAEGRTPESSNLAYLERLWLAAKLHEQLERPEKPAHD